MLVRVMRGGNVTVGLVAGGATLVCACRLNTRASSGRIAEVVFTRSDYFFAGGAELGSGRRGTLVVGGAGLLVEPMTGLGAAGAALAAAGVVAAATRGGFF